MNVSGFSTTNEMMGLIESLLSDVKKMQTQLLKQDDLIDELVDGISSLRQEIRVLTQEVWVLRQEIRVLKDNGVSPILIHTLHNGLSERPTEEIENDEDVSGWSMEKFVEASDNYAKATR